jgi:hypothetical protein
MISSVLSYDIPEKPIIVKKKKTAKKVKSANRNVAPKLSSMTNDFEGLYKVSPTPLIAMNDNFHKRSTSLITSN